MHWVKGMSQQKESRFGICVPLQVHGVTRIKMDVRFRAQRGKKGFYDKAASLLPQ